MTKTKTEKFQLKQPADYSICNDDLVQNDLTPPGSGNRGDADYTMKKMKITFLEGMAALLIANRARFFRRKVLGKIFLRDFSAWPPEIILLWETIRNSDDVTGEASPIFDDYPFKC